MWLLSTIFFTDMWQKRETFSAGSWNIQEEIRRVRSKATENMLRTLPSTRIDLSSFALEPKTFQHSFVTDKIIGGNGDRMHASNSLTPTELVDASVNLAAGLSTCHDLPGKFYLSWLNISFFPVINFHPWETKNLFLQILSMSILFFIIIKLCCRRFKTYNTLFRFFSFGHDRR